MFSDGNILKALGVRPGVRWFFPLSVQCKTKQSTLPVTACPGQTWTTTTKKNPDPITSRLSFFLCSYSLNLICLITAGNRSKILSKTVCFLCVCVIFTVTAFLEHSKSKQQRLKVISSIVFSGVLIFTCRGHNIMRHVYLSMYKCHLFITQIISRKDPFCIVHNSEPFSQSHQLWARHLKQNQLHFTSYIWLLA